jgi:phosphohistidine phosphatase SixA
MTDVEQLLRDYIREHRAGREADPRAFVSRVDAGTNRRELEALIDAYLEHAPRAAVDRAATSPAVEAVVDQVLQELDQPGQTWRVLLPSLRMQARLKRDELVRRLSEALGVVGHEPKVARYYNAMEHEQLEAAGISSRVYEALAALVNTSADALRRAAPRPPSAEITDFAFARSAPWESDPDAVAAAAPAAPPSVAYEVPWDEVDELFRGG